MDIFIGIIIVILIFVFVLVALFIKQSFDKAKKTNEYNIDKYLDKKHERAIPSKVFGTTSPNEDGINRQSIIATECVKGMRLKLAPFKYNNLPAVKVLTGDDKQIGHLKREIASQLFSSIKKSKVLCVATKITGGSFKRSVYGIDIMLIVFADGVVDD